MSVNNSSNNYNNNRFMMSSMNNIKQRGSISALTQSSGYSASEGITFLLTALVQLNDVIRHRYVEMMKSMSCLSTNSNNLHH